MLRGCWMRVEGRISVFDGKDSAGSLDFAVSQLSPLRGFKLQRLSSTKVLLYSGTGLQGTKDI